MQQQRRPVIPLNDNVKDITLIKWFIFHSELINICSYEWTEIVGAAVKMTTLANLIPFIRFHETRLTLVSLIAFVHFMDSFE